MRSWLKRVGQGVIPSLWFLFGELCYKFLTHHPPPVWRDFPGYLATLSGFLLSYSLVRWRAERRRTREKD